MNLKEILAISGHPGLFKLVSQAKNGIIVESLIDKSRFPTFASSKVSALEDVAIFTEDGETPLKEVLLKIYEKEQGGPALNHKTSTVDELKSYFSEILPEYNREKVYVSDIKKVFMWYNTLHQADMLNLPEEKTDGKVENEGKADEGIKPEKKVNLKVKKKSTK